MSLTLIVENDRNELNIYEFSRNFITVGRSPDNDLVLVERNVSRYHFQIDIVEDRILIKDMESYNHTYVNDRTVNDKLEIFVGDIITVGDYNIYIDQDKNSMTKTALSADSKKIIAQEDLFLAKTGPLAGKVFYFKGSETVIGSHSDADIYLNSKDILKVHSKLIFDGNIYTLVKGNCSADYSLNVNDMEVDSVDMRNGDEFKVNEFVFEFVERGEEYDPYPYQQLAKETRKDKPNINSSSVQSVYDEQDNKTTWLSRFKGMETVHIIVIVAVLAIVVTGTILVIMSSIGSSDIEYLP